MSHCLFVCVTCASTWQGNQRVGTSGGERLLAALEEAVQDWSLGSAVRLQPVTCMNVCSQACSVCLAAPGKPSYLFGQLPGGGVAAAEAVTALLDCAALYHGRPDGSLSWAERPEPLRKTLLAKIPPVPVYG